MYRIDINKKQYSWRGREQEKSLSEPKGKEVAKEACPQCVDVDSP